MKNIWITCLLVFSAGLLTAQTMKWVPLAQGTMAGRCVCKSDSKNNLQCYVLEYTPKVSGTLTSYTTGFLVSCTSMGSPMQKNESCSMTNNVKEISACTSVGKVLFNSSGNTGTTQLSQVEADKPIFLHQVCFQIPAGETITIMEDQLTDLTTSIDVVGSGAVSEFPEYITQTITRPRYDAAKPAALLDFQGTAAGDRIAQLDWSVSNEKDATGYVIERSNDGHNFVPVGEVNTLPTADPVKGYQFVDTKAEYGKNHYRLQQLTPNGKVEFSPVRTITFYENPLTVSVSPNPANEYITVDVLHAKADFEIRIMDVEGQLMKDHRALQQTRQAKLDVQHLNPGVYLILVQSGDESSNEKLVITK